MYVIDHIINKRLLPVRGLLLDKYLSVHGSVSESKRELLSKALSCILMNIYGNGNKIHITLTEKSYSAPIIINGKVTGRKVSYTYTKNILKWLEENKYITLHTKGLITDKSAWSFVKGKWCPVVFEPSYFVVHDKLINLLPEYEPTDLKDIIKLKNKDKRQVSFSIPPHMKDTVSFQRRYNKFSLNSNISVDGKNYYLQSYKVFNQDFNRGGRSYMSGQQTIQNLSKEKRKEVLINGEICVGWDYSAFEPTILYTLMQEVLNEDPYIVDIDYDLNLTRQIGKAFLLRMLNCESKKEAVAACTSYIKTHLDLDKLYAHGQIPSPRVDVKLFIGMLEDKHSRVKDKFYCGFGGELQKAGSLVNDYILDYMMQRDILVIQIHDEYIVVADKEDMLVSCMKDAFTYVLGFNDNVHITKEF